jgi:hypothetical protein
VVHHVEIDYVPAGPTISRFHLSEGFVRILIGPLGSAKTTACCMEVWRRIVGQAANGAGRRRSRWLMVRSTYTDGSIQCIECDLILDSHVAIEVADPAS